MYEELVKKSEKYFNKKEILMIKKAYLFAKDLHKGQKRASGEAYIVHPLNVAYILLEEMHLKDANSICASLLHDTIEDTGITKEFLEEHFNEDIANLVASVSKIKDLNFMDQTEIEQHNTCILLKGLMNDYRVIFIKLADRLHNMRTLEFKKPKKQEEKSKETIKIFVPLAERVGATIVKNELEELAFKYLNNHQYRNIKGNVNNYIKAHQVEIEEILLNINKALLKHNINHDIRIRTKNSYEVYFHWNLKQKLSRIPGLISYEIIVDDFKDCYLALGYLHQVYHPISCSITDYIASPKANGYRSIHTIVNGLKKQPIELKICSKEMSLLNDYGLAVLQTKYQNKTIEEIKEDLSKNNKFIQALKDISNLYKNDNEFLNQVEEEILSTQINVYSRDGENYSLPQNATVLDFAYKIHSAVGNKATKAIVNSKEVNLNYILNDGDSVIVITDELKTCQEESAINYVVTAKAKRKIKEGLNNPTRKMIKR